jgi:hypothetical protein
VSATNTLPALSTAAIGQVEPCRGARAVAGAGLARSAGQRRHHPGGDLRIGVPVSAT